MALLDISRVLAPALIVLGGYSMVGFGQRNGLFPMVDGFREKGVLPSLPSSPVDAFNPKFGFGPLDELLGTMVVFFWPVASGHEPALSLMMSSFGGQAVAGLTILALEGARFANRGKFVSWTTLWSLFIQFGGYAVAAPSHLVASLFTSPLISSSTPLTPSALSIPEGLLSGVPFSIFLGFIVPSIIMALPQPSIISTGTKIAAVALWQPFPIFISISQYLWRMAVSGTSQNSSEKERVSHQLSWLRTVYKLALTVSASAHVATLTLSISTVLFPGIFSPHAIEAWRPANLFIPTNPFSDVKVRDVAQGVLWFNQWDYAVAATAVLLLAVNSRYAAPIKSLNAEAGKFGFNSILSIVARVVSIGPMSAALSLLWERDEIVYAAERRKSS